MGAADFFARFSPLAAQASQGTGLPVSVILAQWALETGYGQSALAQKNNLGGIKFTGNPGSYEADGGHAGYESVNAFLADYKRVVHLPFYQHVREAAAAGAEAVAMAWDNNVPAGTPRYAEDTQYSEKLLGILREYDLTRYDGQAVTVQLPAGVTAPAANSRFLLAAGLAVGLVALLIVGGDND